MFYGIDISGALGQVLIMLTMAAGLALFFGVVWVVEKRFGRGSFALLILICTLLFAFWMIAVTIQREMLRKPYVVEGNMLSDAVEIE